MDSLGTTPCKLFRSLKNCSFYWDLAIVTFLFISNTNFISRKRRQSKDRDQRHKWNIRYCLNCFYWSSLRWSRHFLFFFLFGRCQNLNAMLHAALSRWNENWHGDTQSLRLSVTVPKWVSPCHAILRHGITMSQNVVNIEVIRAKCPQWRDSKADTVSSVSPSRASKTSNHWSSTETEISQREWFSSRGGGWSSG